MIKNLHSYFLFATAKKNLNISPFFLFYFLQLLPCLRSAIFTVIPSVPAQALQRWLEKQSRIQHTKSMHAEVLC